MGRRLGRLPRYVHGYLDRHGKPRHYLRQPGRMKIALPGLPYSHEFMEAYTAALNNAAPVIIGASRSVPGSVAETVARYLGSVAFSALAPSTQAMRRATLERFRVGHGDKRIGKLQAEHVGRLLGKLKPYSQRNMLKTLRGLMAFAVTDRLIKVDPTAGVKLTKVKNTGGFETWADALELLYGTMQRRGDVVRLGRQHVQDGVISLRQNKTGAPVDIPVLPELQAAMDAMPNDHLTFLTTEESKPFSAAGFGNWFRQQCDLAGVSLSAHGLRKAGATRLAEHGCTDHEIAAWGGWVSLTEVQRYTRAANRKHLARAAAGKLKAGTELANLETRLAKQGKKP